MVKLEHILCSMNDRCKGEGLNRCPCCSWPPQSVDRLRHTMIVTFPLFLIHLAILVPSEVRSENDDCQANDVEWNDKDVSRRLKLWASTLGKNDSTWEGKEDGSIVWRPSLLNSGFFYGRGDESGHVTDPAGAFIYPDFHTVYLGSFANNTMLDAKPSVIVAERCQDGVKLLKFQNVSDDHESIRYHGLDFIRDRGPLTVPDPYEVTMVYAHYTEVAEEGLFAKRRIGKGEIVSYFGGLLVMMDQIVTKNMTLVDVFNALEYVIPIDESKGVRTPSPNLYEYRASLAHKVNHSFQSSNLEFTNVFHPRYGIIPGYKAKRIIKKDEELFADYGYDLRIKYLPLWYYQSYMKEVGMLPHDVRPNHVFVRSVQMYKTG